MSDDNWFASGRGIFKRGATWGGAQVGSTVMTVDWQEDTKMITDLLNKGERFDAEVERLTAENARLTAALEWYAKADQAMRSTVAKFAVDLKFRIARAANAFNQPGYADYASGMRYVLGIVDAALSDYDVREPREEKVK